MVITRNKMENKFYVTAVIVAAGNSERMGLDKSKQLINLNGMTVISRSIKAFEESENIKDIIVVCRSSEKKIIEQEIKKYGFQKVYKLIQGGNTRQQSVLNGVRATRLGCEYVAIHDGARCFVKKDDIDKTITAAFKYKAAALAVRVNDTVKKVKADDFIETTINRETLRLVQTPQIFKKSLYLKALKEAEIQKKDYTDDCQLMENIGIEVKIIEGSKDNIKVTTPEDILNFSGGNGVNRMYRIGHGYDVHRLVKGRELILGGIKIEYMQGLLGHSDADVLTHSVMDAILSAAGMKDIGNMFPDSDDRFKGAYSINLLSIVVQKIRRKGFEIGNIDITVIAQAPKLADKIDLMIEKLAKTCIIEKEQVNIKATTEEGLGFTGRKEGIASHCVCLLYKV